MDHDQLCSRHKVHWSKKLKKIEVKQLFSTGPLKARAAKHKMIKTRVENTCKRPFPAQATYGRHWAWALTASGWRPRWAWSRVRR